MITYHLKEIYFRIVYFIISICLSALTVWQIKENWLYLLCDIPLMYIQLSEAFFYYLQLSFYTALIVNLPFLSYHIFSFIVPGIYKYEMKFIKSLILFFNISFFFIILFYFIYLLPVIVEFFLQFDSIMLHQSITFKDYIQFITLILTLAFFTLLIPFLTFIIKVKGYRKFIYMSLLLISAIITPPDVFSLLLTTIPTIILFEIATFIQIIIKTKGSSYNG